MTRQHYTTSSSVVNVVTWLQEAADGRGGRHSAHGWQQVLWSPLNDNLSPARTSKPAKPPIARSAAPVKPRRGSEEYIGCAHDYPAPCSALTATVTSVVLDATTMRLSLYYAGTRAPLCTSMNKALYTRQCTVRLWQTFIVPLYYTLAILVDLSY